MAANGAITTITYDDNSQATFHYDTASNGVGKLQSITDAIGTTSYTYTAFGELATTSQSITGQTFTVTYHYDANGLLDSMQYPSGAVVDYNYKRNQIDSIKIDSQVLLNKVRYDPFGPITGWTWGNGSSVTKTYDLGGFPTSYTLKSKTHAIEYDDRAQIIAFNDVSNSTALQDFDYDALYRLTDYSGLGETRSFGYDPNGNRTTESLNSTEENYVYDPNSNQLSKVGDGDFIRDGAGNRRFDKNGEREFVYNNAGRLAQVIENGQVLATYAYNTHGQRVRKVMPGATIYFHYDANGNMIEESDSFGNVLRSYVYLGNMPVAMVSPSDSNVDTDGDGVIDSLDNCTLVANGDQRNTDGDGFGNICDADFNNDLRINSIDLTYFKQHFFTNDIHADLNGDGFVNTFDLTLFKNMFLKTPGPNGAIQNIHYLHSDHLGTPRVATNQADRIVWRWQGDAFGNTAAESDVDGDGQAVNINLRFPGQYYDDETGLHYNYFRYYDPSIGRYITSDPIGLDGGLNIYGYALSNPLTHIDPTGESATAGATWGGNIGTGIGSLGGPVGAVVGRAVGTVVGAGVGYVIAKSCSSSNEPPAPYYSKRPPNAWPADAGAREWDRKNGGGRNGRDKFHDSKQNSPWPGGKEDWSVDPGTGDIYDPNGDVYDNLND